MSDAILDMARALLLRDLAAARMVKEILVPTPAAGAEWSQLVPGGVVWEILLVRYLFTTSAVVNNRVNTLQIKDADGNQVARFSPVANQAASLPITYMWTAGIGSNIQTGAYGCPLPSPPQLALAGWTIGSLTNLLDVADAFTGIVMMVRDWSAWAIGMYSEYEYEQLCQSYMPA